MPSLRIAGSARPLRRPLQIMDTLVHNVRIYTNDPARPAIDDGWVLIRGTRIHALGSGGDLGERYSDSSRIDGGGRLLMPGLVNAHMHLYSTFARGMPVRASPRNFNQILEQLWWKLDRSLDAEACYYSALVPAITAIRAGVTSVIDHHASPNAVDGSLDRVAEAVYRSGLRAVLCYEVSDRDGKAVSAAGLRENERFALKCMEAKRNDPDHPLDAMVGLHASFTLDEDTLAAAGALSRSLDRGCHIHLCEAGSDAVLTREKYGRGVVERLRDHGILGTRSIAAHGVHLTEADKDEFAETGSILVHNPQSNMNNAVGRTDVGGCLGRGILLGIGTDGMSADIRPDLRTAPLLQKHALADSNAGWSETETIALRNNPAIIERVAGQKVGRIAEGYLADLILVDYHPPTPFAGNNFWGHFLFGVCDATVDTTIINGKIVMRDRELAGLDEERIAFEARSVARKVWDRFGAA
jgi:putative selenium metabolism protein SsnA